MKRATRERLPIQVLVTAVLLLVNLAPARSANPRSIEARQPGVSDCDRGARGARMRDKPIPPITRWVFPAVVGQPLPLNGVPLLVNNSTEDDTVYSVETDYHDTALFRGSESRPIESFSSQWDYYATAERLPGKGSTQYSILSSVYQQPTTPPTYLDPVSDWSQTPSRRTWSLFVHGVLDRMSGRLHFPDGLVRAGSTWTETASVDIGPIRAITLRYKVGGTFTMNSQECLDIERHGQVKLVDEQGITHLLTSVGAYLYAYQKRNIMQSQLTTVYSLVLPTSRSTSGGLRGIDYSEHMIVKRAADIKRLQER